MENTRVVIFLSTAFKDEMGCESDMLSESLEANVQNARTGIEHLKGRIHMRFRSATIPLKVFDGVKFLSRD